MDTRGIPNKAFPENVSAGVASAGAPQRPEDLPHP